LPVKNCPQCRKIFQANLFDICDACRSKNEKDFFKVKEYLEENEKCTMHEVSQETGVSAKRILAWIREGRLEATIGMGGDIACRACGEPVSKGNFCQNCAQKINNQAEELLTSQSPHEKPKGIKMHTKIIKD